MRPSVVLDTPSSAVDARAHRHPRGAGLEERGDEAFERVVPVVIARDRVNGFRHALERKPESRLVVPHRAGGIDHVGGQHDEPHIVGGRGANQRVAQHLLAGIALAGVADDDEGERRRCRSSPAGVTVKPLPSSVVSPAATTARTIAARHVSVRAAAHEFHDPAAQFSVSKYQLMPQIGTEATMTAVSGSPICRPRPNADAGNSAPRAAGWRTAGAIRATSGAQCRASLRSRFAPAHRAGAPTRYVRRRA